MRVEHKHAHAYTRYKLIGLPDYFNLIKSILEVKRNRHKSLTVHLPFEIQHTQHLNLNKALVFIYFGEILKRIFLIRLHWENAPWLNYGTWDLKYSNTLWKYIPKNIDLCLDTGHLMLGIKTKKKYLATLEKTLKERGTQIKHLHLHENNFIRDKHTPIPGKIIDRKLFDRLVKNRTFIIEKGE